MEIGLVLGYVGDGNVISCQGEAEVVLCCWNCGMCIGCERGVNGSRGLE